MVKGDLAIQRHFLSGGAFEGGLDLQHLLHTAAAGCCLGHADDKVCHFDELHQNLGHIVIKGNHHALGQQALVDLQRTLVHQENNAHVDYHEGNGVKQGRNPSGKNLDPVQLFCFLGEFLYLALLLIEGPKNPDTGEILPGGRGHILQSGLDPPVQRHGHKHNAENNHAQQRNHPGKYQSGLEIDGKGHDHGAEHHKRRPEQQPQGQIHAILHLVDIRCHPGNESAGTQGIHIRIGKAQNMVHKGIAQPDSKAHRCLCCKILGNHRADEAHRPQQHQ